MSCSNTLIMTVFCVNSTPNSDRRHTLTLESVRINYLTHTIHAHMHAQMLVTRCCNYKFISCHLQHTIMQAFFVLFCRLNIHTYHKASINFTRCHCGWFVCLFVCCTPRATYIPTQHLYITNFPTLPPPRTARRYYIDETKS